MNITQHLRNEVLKTQNHVPLSGMASYHLLSGSLALSNSVITTGMATTLYTGNGTTQSVVTGVDMATQWGNVASETFGGLVWGKIRSGVSDNLLFDTVRGATKWVETNTTDVEATAATMLTSFDNNGFSISSAGQINTNLATYASWNFQTTHRITGTTNHGKAYTCHYNPFTGFTIVKYEGSGIVGHEIPHHLGRKLSIWDIKDLTNIQDWRTSVENVGLLFKNLTNAVTTPLSTYNTTTDTNVSINQSSGGWNATSAQYIIYGWASSYFDESNTLIGNYELVQWQGTGVAGNKVPTRGKPTAVLFEKRVDSTGNWNNIDIIRGAGAGANPYLQANNANAEGSADFIDVVSDGFILTSTNAEFNANGGQYIALVVYDNDAGSGKSKYPRATDTSTLNLNVTIPFANGVDANGTKNTVLTKNETITGLALTQGKNYVYAKNDGLYGVTPAEPQYLGYNGFGDYFDVKSNQWYQSPSIFSDSFNTNSGWTAGNGATITYVNGSMTVSQTITDGAYATKLFNTVIGKRYRILGDISAESVVNTAQMRIGTVADGVDVVFITTGTGKKSEDFTASATSLYVTCRNSTSVDNTSSTFSNIAIYPVNDDGSVDITSATPITESRNYLDAIVYADAGGQPTFVEQLPKVEYKKDLEVGTLRVYSGFDLNQKIGVVTKFANATYTNSSMKPRYVSISLGTTAAAIISAVVTDIYGKATTLAGSYAAATGQYTYITFVVNPNESYKVTNSAGTSVVNQWVEWN